MDAPLVMLQRINRVSLHAEVAVATTCNRWYTFTSIVPLEVKKIPT